jgi:hypothetical protein
MSRRAQVVAIVVLVAVLALLVPVGRWEHARERTRQARAMRALLVPGGPSLARHLSGYRLGSAFDCLLYRAGASLYAIELCFSQTGRLVEAIDRRPATRVFWSFRDEPEAAPVQIPVGTLLARFHDLGALQTTPVGVDTLPVGFVDGAPAIRTRR